MVWLWWNGTSTWSHDHANRCDLVKWHSLGHVGIPTLYCIGTTVPLCSGNLLVYYRTKCLRDTAIASLCRLVSGCSCGWLTNEHLACTGSNLKLCDGPWVLASLYGQPGNCVNSPLLVGPYRQPHTHKGGGGSNDDDENGMSWIN